MDFDYSQKTKDYLARLTAFMDAHVYPNEHLYHQQIDEAPSRWQVPPIMDQLKEKARAAGLWNLFMPNTHYGVGLTNVEYAPLCEIMGRIQWAGEVFNCSAPDTGNMETIERYGTEAHKQEWLTPLLAGEIRSAFCMTEPAVASSDATNIQSSIVRDGGDYVINGRKWWSSGAGDPRCKILIFMGKTDPEAPKHKQQSMILVPRDTPGVTVMRHLPVFGYDHAPHGHMEVDFKDVRVPVSNILLGEGRGFEIAQGRLGPGRIHHAMRMIGLAERALEYMCKRTKARVAFGKPVVGADGDAGAYRRIPHRHRLRSPSGAEGRPYDGYGRQQVRPLRDRADQGIGTEHGLQGDRLGDPGPWRRRRVGRFPARLRLCPCAHHPARRRPR